mmetsp:Transcript_42473/g.128879  ORF Transcript_42473/g.128879 Transcript_42473/m.128879 type:complete len:81 (+) Transcript_42473:1489-1731(+)
MDGYEILQETRGGAGDKARDRGASGLIVSQKSPRRRQTAAANRTDRHWGIAADLQIPQSYPRTKILTKRQKKEKRNAQVL